MNFFKIEKKDLNKDDIQLLILSEEFLFRDKIRIKKEILNAFKKRK